jgi:hypothetical protein
MPAHTGRLVFCTCDPRFAPATALLTNALQEGGFIGDALSGRYERFAVGERFLQMIIFAGCSTHLDLSPRDGDDRYCHIRISGPFEKPRFLWGSNTRPPRCPRCRTPLRDWRDRLTNRKGATPERLTCPACGEPSSPDAYDWKRQAGFGRLFVQVEEVFPEEGVPTVALMKLLERTAKCCWHHFYIQDP